MTAVLSDAVAERVLGFWRWWRCELEALIPDGLRRLRKPVARADVHLRRDGITVDRERDGVGERLTEERTVDELDGEGWTNLHALIDSTRAKIVLSAPDVFMTRLTFPAAARAHLRSAVAIQLRHASPLDPGLLQWNYRVVADDGRQVTVLVAMMRAERASDLSERFAAAGIGPPPIVAREGEEEVELLCGADLSLSPERRRMRQAAAVAMALVLSTPITTWAASGVLAALERRQVAALHEQLAPRIAEDRLRARDARGRQALAVVLGVPSTTSLIEGLASALPDSAHAVRAERRFDGLFTFAAEAPDRPALEAAVTESRLLHAQVVEAVPAAGTGVQLTFEARPR